MANEKMGCKDIALMNYEKAVFLSPSNIEYNVALKDFRNSNKTLKSSNDTVIFNKNSIDTLSNTNGFINSNVEKEESKNYEELIKQGDEAYKAQKYSEAIDSYTKAVIYMPNDQNTLLKIANTYKLIGNNSKAISFYDKILTLDNTNADAYFNKGLIFASQKKFDDSIKCFEQVIKITPDFPYAYYSLGLAYEQKEEVSKALEYFYLYTGIETDEKMLSVVNQKIKQLEQ